MSVRRVVSVIPGIGHAYKAIESNLAVRIAALMVALIIMLIITLITIHSNSLEKDLSQRMIASAEARTESLANVAKGFLQEGQLFELVKIINEGSRETNVLSASIYDPRRLFLMRKDGIEPGVLRANVEPLVRRSLDTQEKTVYIGNNLYIAQPIYDENRILGVVSMSYSMSDTHTVAQELMSRTSLIGAIFCLVMTPLIFLMMDRLVRPIRKLTAAAERASLGDLSVNITAEGNDEVAVLSNSFNRMLRHLRATMSQVHDLAYIDRITGLPNRERFREIVDTTISKPGVEKSSAILFFDLDRFKRVNDTLGHGKGDELLQEFAKRLQSRLTVHFDGRDGWRKPSIARVGGDEYAVLIPEIESSAEIEEFNKRFQRDLDEPFVIDDHAIVVATSIGATLFPQDGLTFDTLLRNADMAMYKAKDNGGGSLRFYTEDLRKNARNRMVVENELREALESDQFVLYYQPQLSCRTGVLKGVEALIRWDHPEKGILGPGAFIEVAEETGLIVDIGDWVMHKASMQAKAWHDEGRNVRVAVNVSTLQFERPDFIRRVMRALEDSGATPEMIELELTESLAMSDVRAVVDKMEPLRELGIRFAIDDFGSGYSSLGYLSKLSFDCFKIDRSFIQSIGKSSGDDALVRTILGMARSLGYEVVAEGIETMEQYAFLRNEGCDLAQGFLFARPMPARDVELWQDRRQLNMARSLQSSLERKIVSMRSMQKGA